MKQFFEQYWAFMAAGLIVIFLLMPGIQIAVQNDKDFSDSVKRISRSIERIEIHLSQIETHLRTLDSMEVTIVEPKK